MKKVFVIFCVFVLFLSQALAKTSKPKKFCKYGYRIEYKADGTPSYVKYLDSSLVLAEQYFPWGVCFLKPDFLSSKRSQTSSREDEWTRDAMRAWNIKYENYKYNRWGSYDVMNIPAGPLFVESCNRNKYNIIYPKKEELYDPANGEDTIAYYKPYDYWWDFVTFYGVIAMDSNTRWNRAHFVNVMVHELGHALGIPHAPKGSSEFMIAKGFGCDDYNTTDICEFTDYDWVVFLDPYDPPTKEYNNKMRRMISKQEFELYEACYWDPTRYCP